MRENNEKPPEVSAKSAARETGREPEFFTPDELAVKLSMSRKFIEKHIGSRRLPGMIRIGRHWRFRRVEVERQLSTGSFLLENLN